MPQNSNVLNSWKEISNYVNRGVRTVQRWELCFGFPVRRPAGHVRSSVIALRTEIDAWMANREVRNQNAFDGAANHAANHDCPGCLSLRLQLRQLEERLADYEGRPDIAREASPLA